MSRPGNLLFPPAVFSDKFDLDLETKTFVAEASDLRLMRTGPVYNDACDDGFRIVGKTNHMEAVFAFIGAEYDGSGEDITGFRYACVWPLKMKAVGYTALIVND